MSDSVQAVGTPEGVTFQLHPAGPFPRLLALVIDGLLAMLILLAVAGLLALAHLSGTWIVSLVSFVVLTFGAVACEQWWGGATPGKHALHLRVVMTDGRPVTLQGSLLRNVLRVVDQLLLLGWLVPLFSPHWRRLGDWVGGTLVVYRHDAQVPWRASLSVEPLAPQRLVGEQAAEAALEFGRRWDEFGPGLRRELALEAGDLYRLEPGIEPEKSLLGVAEWYRRGS